MNEHDDTPVSHRLAVSMLLALSLHLNVWSLINGTPRPAVHVPIETEMEIVDSPPPVVPPNDVPLPPPAAEPPRAPTPQSHSVTAHMAPHAAPPLAVSPAPASSDAPLEFGDKLVARGRASVAVGGVSHGAVGGVPGGVLGGLPGTGSAAHGSTTPAPAPQLSAAVSLDSEEWHCAWPHEADLDDIDFQTVTLRVQVEADGRASAVELLSDPEHGFGPAARSCALQTHFSAARDQAGEPARAWSPPIHVHFTR